MSHWVQIKGIIQQGYGVASGRAGDPRFPGGTIEMQKSAFAARGLNLEQYFPGTINVSIHPHQYAVKQAKYTFRNVQWALERPAEDFSFFDCRVTLSNGSQVEGLVYYPHPETKPEHFQNPEIIEVILPFVEGLQYGDELLLEVDPEQIEITS